MKFVKSCREYIGPSKLFDTAHRVLIMNVAFPCTKRYLHIQLHRNINIDPKPRVNVSALGDSKELQAKLSEELDVALGEIDINDMNELNEKITSSVRECVENVCPKIDPHRKMEPWEYPELNQQMKHLHKCVKQGYSQATERDQEKEN